MVEEIKCNNGIRIVPPRGPKEPFDNLELLVDYRLDLKDFYPYSGFGNKTSLNRVDVKPIGHYSGPYNKSLIGVDPKSIEALGTQIKYVASEALKEFRVKNTDVNNIYVGVHKKLEGPPAQSPIAKEQVEKYRLTDDTLIKSAVMMSSTRCSDFDLSSELNELIQKEVGLNTYIPVEVDCVQGYLNFDEHFRISDSDLKRGDFYLGEWT